MVLRQRRSAKERITELTSFEVDMGLLEHIRYAQSRRTGKITRFTVTSSLNTRDNGSGVGIHWVATVRFFTGRVGCNRLALLFVLRCQKIRKDHKLNICTP